MPPSGYSALQEVAPLFLGRLLEGFDGAGRRVFLLEARGIERETLASRRTAIDEELSFWRAVEIPGVLRPLDLVVEGDTAWLITEHRQGLPLAGQRVALAGAGAERLFTLLSQCLEILERLHRIEGRPVLAVTPWSFILGLDGGPAFINMTPLLRLLPSGCTHLVVPGVPGFASPEHMGRGNLQPASDLYSLGAVFHYLLTGATPPEAIELLLPDVELPPLADLAPGAPADLASVVEGMMEVILERRPAACGEVREEIRRLTEPPEPPCAPPERAAPAPVLRVRQSAPRPRRNLALQREYLSLPLFALLLGILLFLLTAGAQRARAPRPAPSPVASRAPAAPPSHVTWMKNVKDSSLMILVPAGPFAMGSEYGELNERPAFTTDVPAFYIDKFEITNEQFSRFVRETRYRPQGSWQLYAKRGRERHPAVAVSWYDAGAYARWAGKRLPTEEEWEKAARGGDMRRWPWGNTWDPARLNCMETALGNTAAVGSYPRGVSPYGVHDMAGNVWEWTADWLLPYPKDQYRGMEVVGAEFKVARGGSRNDGDVQTRTCARRGYRPGEGNSTNGGFRCVKSTP